MWVGVSTGTTSFFKQYYLHETITNYWFKMPADRTVIGWSTGPMWRIAPATQQVLRNHYWWQAAWGYVTLLLIAWLRLTETRSCWLPSWEYMSLWWLLHFDLLRMNMYVCLSWVWDIVVIWGLTIFTLGPFELEGIVMPCTICTSVHLSVCPSISLSYCLSLLHYHSTSHNI